MNKLSLRVLPAAILAALSGVAMASSFQLMEQNASGLGVAYAGSAAVADNASTIFFNPAGMTQLPGRQVSLGIAAVGPSYKFRNQGSTGIAGDNGGDAGAWAGVPNAYLSWQLTPQLFAGLGISVPFGLGTKYEDSNWIGRFHSIKSEIQTINVNPSLAYRVSDRISLGFGLNYQTAKAEMTTAVSTLKGDDAAWGWNAGALFTLSPAMRVGVAYRSSIDYKLEGSLNTLPAKAKLELPDTFTLSVWEQVSDRWEAMGDLSYTNWSTVDRLNVYSRTSGALLGSENFGYENSWRFAWGAAYKYSDSLKYKFGIAYDRTPVSDSTRTARVPDNNRIWLSLGGQWKPSRESALDVGYAYIYMKDPRIEQVKGTRTLSGRYDNSGHVLGLQYTQGF